MPESTSPDHPMHGLGGRRDRAPCADLLTTAPGTGTPFRRLFPELPAAKHDFDALLCLANATEPSGPDPNTLADVLSGIVFLGQFIDHDITFQENTPELGTPHPVDGDPPEFDDEGNEIPRPPPVTNCRDPLFNLDSVYGAGPDDPSDPESAKLYENRYFKLVGNRDIPRDGPRIGQREIGGNADLRLIADPRNDENVLVLQVHVLFMRLHNVVLRELAQDPAAPTKSEFKAARNKVVEAYRHIVYFEYLTSLCGDPNLPQWVKNTVHATRFQNMSQGPNIALSVEFAAAAFRFQHSQVRGGYNLNNIGVDAGGRPNGRVLFGPPDNNLAGNQKIEDALQMDFAFFFAGANTLTPNNPPAPDQVNRAMAIDGLLSGPLFNLPPAAIGDDADVEEPDPDVFKKSLAARNLVRGHDFGLPSGQAIARLLVDEGQPGADVSKILTPDQENGPKVLTPEHIAIDCDPGDGEDLNTATPLWFYILREAEILYGGAKLGPVGSRILAEVFVGLLMRDGLPFPGQSDGRPALGSSFSDLVNYVQSRGG